MTQAVFLANGTEYVFDIPKFDNDREQRLWWKAMNDLVIRTAIPDFKITILED